MNFFDKLFAKIKAWFTGAKVKAQTEYEQFDNKVDDKVDQITNKYKTWSAEKDAEKVSEKKVEVVKAQAAETKASEEARDAVVAEKIANDRAATTSQNVDVVVGDVGFETPQTINAITDLNKAKTAQVKAKRTTAVARTTAKAAATKTTTAKTTAKKATAGMTAKKRAK